ncbi:hypothetical protein ACFOLJ_07385 [Rugamonas sp. CCM 8940]|nr:hypothetical protein [Rugamonas sp. CCM 8940]MBJ7310226.1 hypothetical protein [Rugamonas sp. CCM 8940]
MGALAELEKQDDPGKVASAAELKESNRQEAAMRNDCRKKLGLALRK